MSGTPGSMPGTPGSSTGASSSQSNMQPGAHPFLPSPGRGMGSAGGRGAPGGRGGRHGGGGPLSPHMGQPVEAHPGAVPAAHLSASSLSSQYVPHNLGMGGLTSGLHHDTHQLGAGRAAMGRQFVGEALHQQLAAAAYAAQAQWSSSMSHGGAGLPERVGIYHTLYPLEDIPGVTSAAGAAEAYSSLGLRTSVLKGISNRDGVAYALRRVDGAQVPPHTDVVRAAHLAVETWAPLAAHPCLVGLRHAFVSADMESTSSLFFVYDFHAGSTTLAAAHLSPTASANGVTAMNPVPEQRLWSWLVQLGSAARAVHSAGLALRPACLHPTKVLLTPLGRLRVSCCGLVDAMAGDPTLEREDLYYAHRLDLTALGQLLLALACVGLVPPSHPGSMEVLLAACQPTSPMGQRYSRELCRLVGALLAASEGGPLGSARQLCSALAEHSMQEMESAALAQDLLLAELARESENGRLLRLMVRLNFVLERPEGDVDGSWAETGDRYLLKLFRDFVFHQHLNGGPMLDWGLVTEALNKLDAGVPERILLLARDSSAMLIASYADIKRCVDSAYLELKALKSSH